jgi:hypothetical protein
VHDIYDARQAVCQAVGHPAGAVRRIVVYDKHGKAGHVERL